MADPNQTPSRGDWACPCNGCQKAVAWERKQLIKILKDHRLEYLQYRGSSFDSDLNLIWAKDDVMAYVEALDYAILEIENRIPKPKQRKA